MRCRPRNAQEIDSKSTVVIGTTGHLGKEVIVKPSQRTYYFNRVFGPESDQEMVFNGTTAKLVDDTLDGYNCTVFAYGQTNTGKTHTMTGECSLGQDCDSDEINKNHLNIKAGIIPRALVRLFQSIEKLDFKDYAIKVSFVELYKEELKDLLEERLGHSGFDSKSSNRLKIFDDKMKKATVLHGLNEVYVTSAAEAMKLLDKGLVKRQVASNSTNEFSSRSHTIFTISTYVKQKTDVSGEEDQLLKVGKLNLVDLAGSENLTNAKFDSNRNRETKMINTSLLTLGRVINALVEKASHVPYRESKLTRLLQDSLGGATKTCIIATISPTKTNLEETVSTLEYANRAKSIKNKPILNKKIAKSELMQDYIKKMNALQADLEATRSKNGVYVETDRYDQLLKENESHKDTIEEQKLRIDYLENSTEEVKSKYDDEINYQKDKLVQQQETIKALERKNKELAEEQESTKKQLAIENKLRLVHEADSVRFSRIIADLTGKCHEISSDKHAILEILKLKNDLLKESAKLIINIKAKIADNLNRGIRNEIDNHSNKLNKASKEMLIGKGCELLLANNKNFESLTTKSSKEVEQFVKKLNEKTAGALRSFSVQNGSLANSIVVFDSKFQQDISEIGGLIGKIEDFEQSLKERNHQLQTETLLNIEKLTKNYETTTQELQLKINDQNSIIKNLRAQLKDHSDDYKKLSATTREDLKVLLESLGAEVRSEEDKMIQVVINTIQAYSKSRSLCHDKFTHELQIKLKNFDGKIAENMKDSTNSVQKVASSSELIHEAVKRFEAINVKTKEEVIGSSKEGFEYVAVQNQDKVQNALISYTKNINEGKINVADEFTKQFNMIVGGYNNLAVNIGEEQQKDSTVILSHYNSFMDLFEEIYEKAATGLIEEVIKPYVGIVENADQTFVTETQSALKRLFRLVEHLKTVQISDDDFLKQNGGERSGKISNFIRNGSPGFDGSYNDTRVLPVRNSEIITQELLASEAFGQDMKLYKPLNDVTGEQK